MIVGRGLAEFGAHVDGGPIGPVRHDGGFEDVAGSVVCVSGDVGVVLDPSAGQPNVDGASVDGSVDQQQRAVDGDALRAVDGVGVAELDGGAHIVVWEDARSRQCRSR